MPEYREKLWPNAWAFLVTALVIPASILVLVPISLFAGIATAIILYGGCVFLLILAAPVVAVRNGELIAGPAKISTELLGEALVYEKSEATQERGPRLDARAWLLIRGWIDPIVRVPIVDPTDPAPYWVISSRRPKELAAAINESRTANGV
jgi:hypothetical protein